MIPDATTDDKKAFTLDMGHSKRNRQFRHNMDIQQHCKRSTRGDGFRVDFKYPVKGWTATGTVITPNAQGPSWSGTHGNDFAFWTTTSSSLAAIGTGDAWLHIHAIVEPRASEPSQVRRLQATIFPASYSRPWYLDDISSASTHAHNSTAVGNYRVGDS